MGLPCHSIMKGLHNPEMKKLFQSAECGDGNAAEFEMTFSKFLLKVRQFKIKGSVRNPHQKCCNGAEKCSKVLPFFQTLKRTGENCFIPLISGFPQFMKPRKDVVQSVDSCRSREIKTCLLTNNFWLDGRLNSTVMWSNATEHFDYVWLNWYAPCLRWKWNISDFRLSNQRK